MLIKSGKLRKKFKMETEKVLIIFRDDNITEFGGKEDNDGVLQECKNIVGIDLMGCPNLTSIGDGALRGCSSLKSINIPENLTKFGVYVFRRCLKLTPPEIAEQGQNAVIAFLRERSIEGNSVVMSIAKVMVSGPGSAGKTCLIHKLANLSSDFLEGR